jgi:hypothetical protein
MLTDAQSSVKHIEAVLAMAQRLASLDIAIYEHSYNALVFGSWTIVAGKRKERVRFSWDGRDGFLTVEQAGFPDSRQHTNWEHVKTEGVDVRNYTEALDAAERFLRQKFTV